MVRGEFIKHGFTCGRGLNGGWVVSSPFKSGQAAFSSFAEMIAWLEDEHEGLAIGVMMPEENEQ